MPNFDTYLEPSYSEIYLIYADDPNVVTTLEVYYNNEFLLAIDAPTFVLTDTSVGQKWIYSITPTTLSLTEFKDGLYHFVIADANPNGVIVGRDILCCMAKALTNVLGDCGDCSSTAAEDEEKINKVHALLVGSDAALRSGNIDLTMCGLDAIKVLCEECGCGDDV